MLASQAHSFRQQARLAITLAWVAGCTNIVTLLACGTTTSHVTGNASGLASHVTQFAWGEATFKFFLVFLFFLGAMLSGILTEVGRRRGWESIYIVPMVVQAVCLTVFAIGVEVQEPAQRAAGLGLWSLTGTASLAMGLQNATITRISSGVVRTTHLTGVVTDLGTETVQFLLWLRDSHRNSPPLSTRALARSVRVHPTARRLALLISIVGSFVVGATVGTVCFEYIPRLSMLPPVVFLLWIVWQDARTPICEIEAMRPSGGGGFDMPDGLAAFHLRKHAGRRDVTHRLPDLLRWCERLPATARVVILDIQDMTILSNNASLEMRALIHRLQGGGRRIIFSGLSREQFDAIRAAGADDALDADNVCPDLELAIARGLMLLEDVIAAERSVGHAHVAARSSS